MSRILHALQQQAQCRPQAIALTGDKLTLNYAELLAEVERVSALLLNQTDRPPVRVLGLLLDNGPAWIVADLAAMHAGITLVPLPAFFSNTQLQHALNDAGVDTLWTDQPHRFSTLPGSRAEQSASLLCAGQSLHCLSLASCDRAARPQNISKVTYTSGTTGHPKGVCLRLDAMERVARSLQLASGLSSADTHLCVLPLATLLENIAGVYAPLLAGAHCVVPSLSNVGIAGAAQLNVKQLHGALAQQQASTVIFTPQLLQALLEYIERGASPLPALRFLAVGGAPVARTLLDRAQHCALPVYEGYGLSECSSVVAVNTAAASRPGSVGKPLPHVLLQFADDGELLIGGAVYSGYLGETAEDGEQAPMLPSGDIGYVDDDGYLHITGRKKNMFITSFGRNIAPEWVERELTVESTIAQAVVFGESRPWNTAIIVTASGLADNAAKQRNDVARAVAAANARLPDYARIREWLIAEEPFCIANGQYTATGRPRRAAIWQMYGRRVNALYDCDNFNERETA